MPQTVTEYLLTEPFVIHRRVRPLPPPDGGEEVLVHPRLVGVCGSDLHYFKGDKDPVKLARRLPLIPLHEGVVWVESLGTHCSVIPFTACGACPACRSGRENLCLDCRYMGSTAPGLARSAFHYPRRRLVEVPPAVPLPLATLVEPLSIVLRMLEEIPTVAAGPVAVIGTGLMGRVILILLSEVAKVPPERLFLIGRKEEKLARFKDICRTVNTIAEPGFGSDMANAFPWVVEAVGGRAMVHSLEMAVSLAEPGGTLLLYGLSDAVNHLNLSNVVNKGLTLRGVSRSLTQDYDAIMAAMAGNPRLMALLERVVDPNHQEIGNENDLMNAFHYALAGGNHGRVLLRFSPE